MLAFKRLVTPNVGKFSLYCNSFSSLVPAAANGLVSKEVLKVRESGFGHVKCLTLGWKS
jgi:hypothetical protein